MINAIEARRRTNEGPDEDLVRAYLHSTMNKIEESARQGLSCIVIDDYPMTILHLIDEELILLGYVTSFFEGSHRGLLVRSPSITVKW